jgi:hypothetical protein
MTIEVITWEDIFELDGPWSTVRKAKKAAKQKESYLFKQVGFVIEETDEYILMTSCIGAGEQVGSPTRLPKAVIRERCKIDL